MNIKDRLASISESKCHYILGGCVYIFTISVLVYINFLSGPGVLLHNDHAGEMVLAYLLYEEGGLLSSNWYHATELRVFGIHNVYSILFNFISDWQLVHAVGNFILLALMILSYYFLCLQLKLQKSLIFLTSSFLLFMPSVVFLEVLGRLAFYIPHVIFAFLYLGIFISMQKIRDKPVILKLLFLFLFISISVIGGLAGVRYIKDVLVPLVIYALVIVIKSDSFQAYKKSMKWSLFIDVKNSKKFFYLLMSVAGGLFMLVGWLINTRILSQLFTYHTFENTRINSILHIITNLIPQTFMQFFFTIGFRNAFVISVGSLLNIALLLFIPSMVILMRFRKNSPIIDTSHKIAFYFCPAAILVITFFSLITGEIADRYFIPGIVFFIPMLCVYMNHSKIKFDKILIIMLVIGLFGINTYRTTRDAVHSGQVHYETHVADVKAVLTENNLTYGYADFRNSHIFTYLTNGEVEVVSILDDFTPYRRHTRKDYYIEGTASGTAFLLLSNDEFQAFTEREIADLGSIVFHNDHFTILLYDAAFLQSYVLANDKPAFLDAHFTP